MNKKNYRLVGTINSHESMQNLISDLENARSVSQSTGFICDNSTMSQYLQSSQSGPKSSTKKPLTEVNTCQPKQYISKKQQLTQIAKNTASHKKLETNKSTLGTTSALNTEHIIHVFQELFQ